MMNLCNCGKSCWQYNLYMSIAIRSLYRPGPLHCNFIIPLIKHSSPLVILSLVPNSSARKHVNFIVVVFCSNFMTDTISFMQWIPCSCLSMPRTYSHLRINPVVLLIFLPLVASKESKEACSKLNHLQFYQINHTESRPKLTVTTIWKPLLANRGYKIMIFMPSWAS